MRKDALFSARMVPHSLHQVKNQDGILTLDVIYTNPNGSTFTTQNIFATKDADTSNIDTIFMEEYNELSKMTGRQVIETNRAFTLQEPKQFMREYRDTQEYNDFFIIYLY